MKELLFLNEIKIIGHSVWEDSLRSQTGEKQVFKNERRWDESKRSIEPLMNADQPKLRSNRLNRVMHRCDDGIPEGVAKGGIPPFPLRWSSNSMP